eukprot:scaffold6254_cov138-Amphora_coffeaeformis.AAC.2
MNDLATESENMPPPLPRTPRVAAPATTRNEVVETTTTTASIPSPRTTTNLSPTKRRQSLEGLPPRHPPHPKQRRRFSVAGPVPRGHKKDTDNTVVDKSKDNDKEDGLEYSGDEEEEDEDETKTDPSQKHKETLTQELNSMMKMGLQACHDRERMQKELTTLKDDNAAKASENARLRTALKQKQEIITVRTLVWGTREIMEYFGRSAY